MGAACDNGAGTGGGYPLAPPCKTYESGGAGTPTYYAGYAYGQLIDWLAGGSIGACNTGIAAGCLDDLSSVSFLPRHEHKPIQHVGPDRVGLGQPDDMLDYQHCHERLPESLHLWPLQRPGRQHAYDNALNRNASHSDDRTVLVLLDSKLQSEGRGFTAAPLASLW